jgi:hypothetical protein
MNRLTFYFFFDLGTSIFYSQLYFKQALFNSGINSGNTTILLPIYITQ